ncbi:MAG: TonB-dependent receptor [Gammaproteobacteria bacterium]|nr:TonB-dependent receptor [Gammaproteobacteria bacterium]
MSRLNILCAALAGLVPLLSHSAPPLDAVLVTATRIAQPLREVLASADLIDAAELERHPATDLSDLLRWQAGVEVAKLGGPGQQTSLFLRGTESNHVLVLVDGVRINPGTIGSAAIQNIAPELVERVEIIKGPRSVLYGSDAIGGVINVITRSGAAAGTRAQVGVGHYGTRQASFAAGFGGAAGDVSFGSAWLDSAGFPTRTGDVTDRGYRNLSLTTAANARFGVVELDLRAWHARGTSEYSDFFVTPVDQDFRNSAVALTAAGQPAAAWSTRVTLSYAHDQLFQNQSADFVRTGRWTLDWRHDLAIADRHTLTTGLLLQDEHARSASWGLGFASGTTTRQFYLQDQASFGRHRLLLAAGHTDHETFGGHQTWNVEYGLRLGTAWQLTAAAGTAFRAPDATDRYGYGGNPALEPERSQSQELSLRYQPGPRQWFTLTAFRNDIRDLIQFVVTDYATFAGENRNVDRARIDGVEAQWRYTGELWNARLGATWQDPRDRVTDTRLLRRARENFTVGLSRNLGPHQFALDLLYAGARHDWGFPQPERLTPYWLANLSARLALPDHWTLLARMENLLDEDYELARGYNTMGRSLFVAVRHDWR